MTTLSSTVVETVTPAAVTTEKPAEKTVQPPARVVAPLPVPVVSEVVKQAPIEAPKTFQTANTSQPAAVAPQEALKKEAAAKTAERLRMFLLGYI